MLAKHQLARAALIEAEVRRSHHYHPAPLSTKEHAAIAYINALRSREEVELWNDGEGVDSKIWRNMPFNTLAQGVMHRSKLFELIKGMNKGALLHCHLDAINDPYALLALALAHSNLAISSSIALTSSSQDSASIIFETLPPHHLLLSASGGNVISIQNERYEAGELRLVSQVRAGWEGGAKAFDEFVVGKLIVKEESKDWSPTRVWAHFQSTFNVSAGLLFYEPVFEAYIEQSLELALVDKVPYIEARINFLPQFMVSTATAHLDLPHSAWLEIFSRVVKKMKAKHAEFWGAKVIYSTIRVVVPGSEEVDGIRWALRDCIKLKQEFPEVICGFDLVAWEDGLRPLIDYVEDLLWFQTECTRVGVEIPFIFHAGETNGDGSIADQNLYDAILLGTKRIGHGFSLVQHPLLMEICRERNIAIEVCPLSNELLRYTTCIATHPVKILLNSDVPVTLSCDDPQFFGNQGLTYDFYSLLNSSEKMDIVGLGRLARKSIKHSMMSDQEKLECLRQFDLDFDQFLDRVVAASLA